MYRKITQHIAIPGLIVVIFFASVSLPIELIGCLNRGLLAVGIALTAGLLAIAAATKGVIDKIRGEKYTVLWIISSLILALPAAFIVLVAR